MRDEARHAATNTRRNITLALAAALTLRAVVALVALAVARPAPQFREPDSDGYLRLAKEWLRTGQYAFAAEPEILRPPGYPLLLLPGIALNHAELVTIVLQNLLACVTVWLVYRTALVLFNNDAATALGAAWLFACEPLSVLYTSKVLSETAFTTMISAAVYLLARYVVAPSWRRVLAAAVCLAAAAYLRPIAYYLPLWLAISLLAIQWRRTDRRRLFWQTLAFTALSMALLAAWQFRNWKQTAYTGFSAVSDKNLYYYEALPLLAERRAMAPAQREQARREAGETDVAAYLRRHPEQAEWTAAERYRFLRAEAIRTIRAHPLAWARIHFIGVLRTLTDSGRGAWLSFFRLADARAPARHDPPGTFWRRLTRAASERPAVLAIHAVLIAIVGAYLVLAFAGVLRSLRSPPALLALSVAVYLLVLSGGDAGYHRFRLPITPAICLFAAGGYAYVMDRGRRWFAGKHDA